MVIFFRSFGGQRSLVRWLLSVSCLAAFAFEIVFPVSAEAQRRLAPRPIPYSELELDEGRQRLEEMRQMGIEGVHSFPFELRVMPRRGEESWFRGQLWGSRNESGPVFRYEIESRDDEGDRLIRLLVQNGFDPDIWIFDTSEENPAVRRMPVSELFSPIRGTHFTPFDIQMPYLFWQDFAYEGLSRVRGRSSHGFLMYPPDELVREFPWLAGVRIFLDAEFNALTAAEVIGEEGEIIRSFNLMEIKRVEEEWIVKSIDYRNRQTGDKTRLAIRGAAFGLSEADFMFSPEVLEKPFPIISREQFTLF